MKRQWIELKDVEWEDCKKIREYLDERNADYGLVDADPYGLKEGWLHHITIKPSWNLMRDFREDLKKMGISIKRAKYFILCNGEYFINPNLYKENIIKNNLILENKEGELTNGKQLCMWNE